MPFYFATGEAGEVQIAETSPMVGADGIAYIIRRYRMPAGDKFCIMTAHHKGYTTAPLTVARIYNVLYRKLATPALAHGPWHLENPFNRSHRSDYRRKQELNRMSRSVIGGSQGFGYRNPKYHYAETVSHKLP